MTTTTTTKYEVWVGRNLFHDWESRGLLSAMRNEEDALEILVQNKMRTKILATETTLTYLADDAAYQVSDNRDAAPSAIRTNLTFIARVEEALKEAK